MAKTNKYQEAYARLKEERDARLFCNTKGCREQTQAGLNARGDERDLYKGAQLVLRRRGFACLKKAKQSETLERIKQYCGQFLKQDTETLMGEILG
ncbi:hypothetical protein IFR05_007794 [Cadophora sp. M221]|nr:hypothetical protein IFR05_007794 [Cadophora sp. M221]